MFYHLLYLVLILNSSKQSHMARSKIIIGILSFGLIAAITSLASATSVQVHASHRTHNYSIIGGNPDVVYYVNAPDISPALAVDNVYLNVPNFEYPKPANDGKYDNRVKSFAQNWISWQVASHYRS